ncbi:hypothetical protein PTKIN_Ptkin11bG0068400 [Pterospermum kingtungense]
MASKFVGTIKSFWDSIKEYCQVQWFNTLTVTEAISYLAQIFCGQELHRMDKLKEQFFKLKCCSLHPKDMARHYKRFSKLFYLLGGFDDVNMKQAFLNSVPDDLAQQIRTQINLLAVEMKNMCLGDIYKIMLRALDKIGREHRYIQNLVHNSKRLRKPCSLYTSGSKEYSKESSLPEEMEIKAKS